MNSVIVWDLETIPDLRGFAAANDLDGKSDDEIREAMGDKFPKHIYHSIACIGALIAHRYTDDAVDLCDVLPSFSSQSKATLHELCRVMGVAR
jgi:hypothetical protein